MTTTPTATPRDNRDAWLKLVSHLERNLLSTKENAKAVISWNREHPGSDDVPRYQATAWAAQRLLDAIQGLPVPEVPVDHAEGQASILEELGMTADRDGEDHACPDGPHFCPRRPSTSGDEPVEHRPRRLLDDVGDRWEELEDGRWAYVPSGAEGPAEGQTPYIMADGLATGIYGPVLSREELERQFTLRDPVGDEYDRGARDDGQ